MNLHSIKPGKEINKSDAPVIFEFEGKGQDVQPISLDLLKSSIRRESGLAGIRSIPAQYWNAYNTISNMVEESKLNFQHKEIYVQNNSSKAYLTDDEKEAGFTQKNAPINRWRFDKIISTIQLPNIVADKNISDLARNAAIGISLNKEGLSIAFGMNVYACTNFNVMGGTIMHSYGQGSRDSMPWDLMKHRLQSWISQIDQIWSVQNDIMKEMMNYQLPAIGNEAIDEIIGGLYIGALKNAYFKGDPVPFNTHELSDFVQESIRQQRVQETVANVWDLYNWGTSIMKPGRMDIGEISTNSNMWSDYLIDHFNIDAPKEIFAEEVE